MKLSLDQAEPVAWTTKLALDCRDVGLGWCVSARNLWGDNGVPLYTAIPAAQLPLMECLGTVLRKFGFPDRDVAEVRAALLAELRRVESGRAKEER